MARPINKQLHQARSEEILTAARAQLAEEGLGGFSLRAIARRLELAPNALYTYFPSLDDLITALLVDAFQEFAAAIAAADSPKSADYARRFQSICLAYRAWAVAYPTDYDLIFGRPIPGYHAPEAVTAPLSIQALGVGLRVLVDAARAGQLQPPPHYKDIPLAVATAVAAQPYHPDASPELRSLMLSAWSRLHGLVSLEIHGNADGAVGDFAGFYAHNVRALLVEIGLSP
jgi:AcrR family transcriptional regulator